MVGVRRPLIGITLCGAEATDESRTVDVFTRRP
jgi:hypothetical protein